MDWQRYPLMRLAVPYVAGMSLAYGCHGFSDFVFHIFVAMLVVSGMAMIVVGGLTSPVKHRPLWFGACVMVFAFVTGSILFHLRFRQTERLPADGTSVCAIVEDVPQPKARTYAVPLRCGDTRILVYLSKGMTHAPQQLHIGDTLCLRLRSLEATSPRLVPEDSIDHILRSYRNRLFFSGISATCFVAPSEWERRPAASSDSGWRHWVNKVREHIHLTYAEQGWTYDATAVVEAMTVGNREHLSSALRETYAHAGVSHILALSGFHLTMLLLLFNVFVEHFCVLRFRRFFALLFIPLVWAYCALAGFPPSLVRATTMCSVLQLCLLCGMQYQMLNATTLTAVLMLTANPLLLADVGFQLSFVCVLGIVFFSTQIFKKTSVRHHVVLDYLGRSVVITFAASMAAFPLVAFHFGQVPVLSVFSNLPMSLFAFVLMLTALLWWLCMGFGFYPSVLPDVLGFVAKMMNATVEWVASLPFATFAYRPTAVEVMLLYVVMGGSILAFRLRSARAIQLALAGIILLCLCRVIA